MEPTPFIAAVVRLTVTAGVPGNLAQAAALCRQARARGAQLCVLENFAVIEGP